ncbi:MAG: GNAT family N-acetyltransferase [Pseudomonadota bacterium]
MAETITMRVAGTGDLPGIDAMLRASYPRLLKNDYPPSVMVTAVPLISRAKPALVASGTYFVAEAGGEIVGAGGWTHAAPPGWSEARKVGHIRHVVTDYRHVRRGIGRALMSRVLDDARAAGMVRLECLSTRTAVPFYATCGFREGREVALELRAGIAFPAVFMDQVLRG